MLKESAGFSVQFQRMLLLLDGYSASSTSTSAMYPIRMGDIKVGEWGGGKNKRGRKVKVRNESRFAMEVKVVLNYW